MKDTSLNMKLKDESELRKIIQKRYFDLLRKEDLLGFDTLSDWCDCGHSDLSELADDLLLPDDYDCEDSTPIDDHNDLILKIVCDMEDLDKKLRRKARQTFKSLKVEILAME